MRNEDIQMPYYRVVMDIWQTFKPDLVSVQQSDEYWDTVVDKYGNLFMKYAGTPASAFARALCVACVNELERLYRIQTGNIESVFGGSNEQSGV